MKEKMTKKSIAQFDKELDILHNFLQDMYEHQFNNEEERIKRIKKCLEDIEAIKTKP